MNRENLSIAGMWLIWLAVGICAAWYGLAHGAEYIAKIVVAVIGGAGTLLVAILTHALTAARDREAAMRTHALTLSRDREIELQKQKQQNYAALLAKIAAYVRSPSSTSDDFAQIHLYSWVVGSPEVIRSTSDFMHERVVENLSELLKSMRNDIGLPPAEVALNPAIFDAQKAPDFLPSRQAK